MSCNFFVLGLGDIACLIEDGCKAIMCIMNCASRDIFTWRLRGAVAEIEQTLDVGKGGVGVVYNICPRTEMHHFRSVLSYMQVNQSSLVLEARITKSYYILLIAYSYAILAFMTLISSPSIELMPSFTTLVTA